MIPSTISEAVEMLLEKLSQEEKKEILKKSKADFLANGHFELGMWIRNTWLYNPDCKIKDDRFAYTVPDNLSSTILERLYDKLIKSNF